MPKKIETDIQVGALNVAPLWSLDPRQLGNVCNRIDKLDSVVSGDAESMEKISRDTATGRPTHDWYGDEIQYNEIRGDGTGIIYAKGVIVRDWPSIAPRWGFCDMCRLTEDAEMMEAHPDVERVAIIADSPGGMAQGNAELYDTLAAMKKPTMGFCEGLSASASYYQMSALDTLYGTRSSEWGSVGTFAVIVTMDGLLEEVGIEVEVVRSGRFKGMGVHQLTEEELKFFQSNIDAFGGQFRADVRKLRSEIEPESLQGQWFMAEEAAKLGFIHGVIRGKAPKEKALARFVKAS